MSVAAPSVPRLADPGRLSPARVALSEWTKLRSVRSTRWSLLVATALTIGFPILFSAILSARWGHLDPAEQVDHEAHPLEISLVGVNPSDS